MASASIEGNYHRSRLGVDAHHADEAHVAVREVAHCARDPGATDPMSPPHGQPASGEPPRDPPGAHAPEPREASRELDKRRQSSAAVPLTVAGGGQPDDAGGRISGPADDAGGRNSGLANDASGRISGQNDDAGGRVSGSLGDAGGRNSGRPRPQSALPTPSSAWGASSGGTALARNSNGAGPLSVGEDWGEEVEEDEGEEEEERDGAGGGGVPGGEQVLLGTLLGEMVEIWRQLDMAITARMSCSCANRQRCGTAELSRRLSFRKMLLGTAARMAKGNREGRTEEETRQTVNTLELIRRDVQQEEARIVAALETWQQTHEETLLVGQPARPFLEKLRHCRQVLALSTGSAVSLPCLPLADSDYPVLQGVPSGEARRTSSGHSSKGRGGGSKHGEKTGGEEMEREWWAVPQKETIEIRAYQSGRGGRIERIANTVPKGMTPCPPSTLLAPQSKPRSADSVLSARRAGSGLPPPPKFDELPLNSMSPQRPASAAAVLYSDRNAAAYSNGYSGSGEDSGQGRPGPGRLHDGSVPDPNNWGRRNVVARGKTRPASAAPQITGSPPQHSSAVTGPGGKAEDRPRSSIASRPPWGSSYQRDKAKNNAGGAAEGRAVRPHSAYAAAPAFSGDSEWRRDHAYYLDGGRFVVGQTGQVGRRGAGRPVSASHAGRQNQSQSKDLGDKEPIWTAMFEPGELLAPKKDMRGRVPGAEGAGARKPRPASAPSWRLGANTMAAFDETLRATSPEFAERETRWVKSTVLR
eukprot:jgi/Mesvir1/6139/Mv00842-RA.1